MSVAASPLSVTPAPAHPLVPPLRPLTLGMVALIAILAFEQLAVATAMLRVAQELNGMALYAAAFGLALASGIVGTVSGGRWSDRGGPVVVLQAGVTAFLVGLVGAGIATHMVAVVAGRALQGFGGGLISVALYVVVARVYTPALRPRVFSGFAAAWVLPAMVGPVLAGWMAETVGWRWVFFSAALLAVPATILLRLGLRPHLALLGGNGQEGPPPADPGWILTPTVAASAALLYGAASGAQPAVWLGIGLLGLGILAPRLLPHGTFRAREGLPTVVLLRGLVAAAFFCGEVLLPLLLVQQRGFSALEAGLVLTAGALGWSAGSWFQGGHPVEGTARIRRLRRAMTAIGIGTLGVAAVAWPAVPSGLAVLAWIVAGCGIGVVFPTLSVLTLEQAAAQEQGRASAALQLSDSLLSTVALALASMLPLVAGLGHSAGGPVVGLALAATLALLAAALAPRVRAGRV